MFGKKLALRCIWMVAYLMTHRSLTFTDYAQTHGLSLRTYRRDLALLNEGGVITRTVRNHEEGKVVFVEARFA